MRVIRKIMKIIAIACLVFIMTSCAVRGYRPLYEILPWGVWVNEQAQLTLYILPEYDLSDPANTWSFTFRGTYVVDGEEIEIHALFIARRGMIGGPRREYELHIRNANNGRRVFYAGTHLMGRNGFWIENGQLHFMHGYIGGRQTMIFNPRLGNDIDIKLYKSKGANT